MVKIIVSGREFSLYVPGDQFDRAVSIMKKYGGSFDRERKAWLFSAVPSTLINELASIGIKVPDEVRMYAYDAIAVGNYYLVPRELAGKVNYDKLRYTVRKFDPDNREYYEVEVRLWLAKEDGSILVPRGLAKEALAGIRFQPFAPWINPNMPLSQGYRDYQVEVIRSVLNDLKLTGASTVMVATGGGKSFMVAGLIKDILNNYGNTVKKAYYVATSIDLVLQFREFARKWGLEIGVVTGDEKDFDKPVVASTAQTLYRALDEVLGGEEKDEGNGDVDEEDKAYLDEVQLSDEDATRLAKDYLGASLVVIDECQHLPARTVKFITKANKWALRIAMSATPWRNDGRDLDIYAVAGSITQRRVTSSELIRRGYLVPAYIIMWKRPINCDVDAEDDTRENVRECIRECLREGGEYEDCVEVCREEYGEERKSGAQLFAEVKRCVFSDAERRRDIADVVEHLVHANLKPVLVLTKEVKPANDLGAELDRRKLRVEIVTGAVKGERRRAIFDSVESLDALVADTIADEGLDLPQLRAMVITGGGASKVRTLQRVGRVVRPWKDKDVAVVIDLWDTAKYFADHGEERLKLYKTEPQWVINIARSKDEVIDAINEMLA